MLQPVPRSGPADRTVGVASDSVVERCNRILSNQWDAARMSTPMAVEQKAPPHKPLIGLPEALSHERRVGVLADRIAMHVESLVPRGRARCLDVGRGDLLLADAIHARAPRTDWRGIDVHDAPSDLHDNHDDRSGEYRALDGCTLPYGEREFDIALLCDVLSETPENAAQLLTEAGRVAQRVLVKDRFEYGSYSRTMLRLMDVVDRRGCVGNGPPRYFTREGFTRLATEQRFTITALDCGLALYDDVPVARTVLRPDSHFIAVLRRI
jgi:hypothetical protein